MSKVLIDFKMVDVVLILCLLGKGKVFKLCVWNVVEVLFFSD